MSSYTSRLESSYQYTPPRVVTPPAPPPAQLVAEAERRVEARMQERVSQLNQAISVCDARHAQEVQTLRREQARALEKIRDDAAARAAEMEEKTGLEFGRVYEAINTVKREAQRQYETLGSRVNALVKDIKNHSDAANARRKELVLRIGLIEAAVESIEKMHPDRFASIATEYGTLRERRVILCDAYDRGAVDELYAAGTVQSDAVRLEKALYALNMDYAARIAKIEGITELNDAAITYLQRAQQGGESLMATVTLDDTTESIPLDLKVYTSNGQSSAYEEMLKKHTECRHALADPNCPYERLDSLLVDAEDVQRMAGSFATCAGENHYIEGTVVCEAKKRASDSMLKEAAGDKMLAWLHKCGFVERCKERKFLNDNRQYPYIIRAEDSRRNESMLIVECEDGNIRLHTQVFGALEESARARRSKTLADNAHNVIGGEEPIYNPKCYESNTPEKFVRQAEIRTAKALAARQSQHETYKENG